MRWLVHCLAIALFLSGFQPAQAAAMAAMVPAVPAITMSHADMTDHGTMDHGAMIHDMTAMAGLSTDSHAKQPGTPSNDLPCSAKMLPCCIALPATLAAPLDHAKPLGLSGPRLLAAASQALEDRLIAPLPDPPRRKTV